MDKPKTKERQEMDTTKSDKIAQDYLQKEPKLKRKVHKFSGTWKTTPEEFFPLLCPSREMDWIPGWTCELIYTQSGYAEDKVIFKTDQSCIAGEGIWAFTGFEKNKFIAFVRLQKDILMHARITATDNKDGTTTGTWYLTSTALTEKGNKIIESMPEEYPMAKDIVKMVDVYLKNPDTIKSKKLVQEFLQRGPKLQREVIELSGTWEATVETLFPLLCPSREVDWIPGWNCEMLYSSTGYAEDKCVFKTSEKDLAGEGIWTFTGYEKNKYIEAVQVQKNVLLHLRVFVKGNEDGTTTGNWNIVFTALNEEGNKELAKKPGEHKKMAKLLPRMIEHYLTKGKKISKAALVMGMAHDFIRGH